MGITDLGELGDGLVFLLLDGDLLVVNVRLRTSSDMA